MLQSSFYRKIQFSFLIFILLPIVTVSSLAYITIKRTTMDKMEAANQSILQLMTKDIEKLLDDISFASHFYVQNVEIRDNLREIQGMTGIHTFDDFNKYTKIRNSYDQVSINALNKYVRLFLVNDTGFIVPYMDVGSGQTLPQMESDWKTVKPRIVLDNPTSIQWLGTVAGSGPDKDTYYYLSRVIRDSETGSLLGTLMIGISSTYFDPYFSSSTSGQFTLFEKNGQRIAGNASIAYSEQELPRKQGERNIRSEAVIAQGNWKLVYETPEKTATGQITQTFFVSAMAVAVFIIMFLMLSFFLARSLHRPIRKLQRIAHQFGEGNRSIRFPDKGRDEISDLGRSFNSMLDEINGLIAGIETEQEQKRVLELQALFAQIRPHFLLNTLNSIKCSLYVSDDRLHGRMIDSLSSLLRAYMRVNEPSTLLSESVLLKHYLEIMNMRNDLALELAVRIPAELERQPMPMLLLQPIVENAVVHGFVDKEEGGLITLTAERAEDRIVIRISDNGRGMTDGQLRELQAVLNQDPDQQSSYRRVGLLNVLQRMRLTYGMSAEMGMERSESGGVTVRLSFPIQPLEGESHV
ncbi:sensor histidine kinase [Paenibacillus chitinolyticus]|uniref:sensor histidine kinase n=1 Tax=Paenibacillus TaxID=44249 RepID=UPI001C48F547|nr:histidine kinase [Paenibacillus chitinolyticus]MBV6713602.1 histidine kinase [Paenibacillus chitinolyticus]